MKTQTNRARLLMRRRVWTMGVSCAFASLLLPSLAAAQTEPSPEAQTTPSPTTEPPAVQPTMPSPSEPTPSPPPTIDEEGSSRKLGRHVFLFPTYVRSSFVSTYFGLRARLGESITPDVPTAFQTSDVNAVTLAEALDLGVKITDWLGFSLTAGVRSLIGTNLRALTYAGATYDAGGIAGLVLRVYHNDDKGTQLSLRAGGGYTGGRISTLLPIFQQPVASAVDALQGDLGQSINTPISTWIVEGAVTFAQAFSPFFGIQASASAGRSSLTVEPYDRRTKTRGSNNNSDVTYSFGAAPSFDFNAFHVPVAVMPEYVYSRQASTAQPIGEREFDTTHTLSLGVYYSGRKTLQVGLSWATVLGAAGLTTPQGVSGAPAQHSTEFILRYIW